MTRTWMILLLALSFAPGCDKDKASSKESKASKDDDDDDKPAKKKKKKAAEDDEEEADDKGKKKKPKDDGDDSMSFSCSDKVSKAGEKTEFKVKCPKDCTTGSVWGTGWYTGDSPVCVAAVHAGVIEADAGGMVTVKIEKGLPSYVGTKKFDVTTASWGTFEKSFSVNGSKDGNTPPAVKVSCWDTLAKFPGKKTVAVSCPASCTGGTVYGSGPYTGDSAICVAAVHAGKITKEGGEVSLHTVPGLSNYPGSTKNGVGTSSWTSYWASAFQFD
jgi:hypothetical protein